MRATLLGHACWLLETTAGCFLTDPVRAILSRSTYIVPAA